jgi:hypothetical protein
MLFHCPGKMVSWPKIKGAGLAIVGPALKCTVCRAADARSSAVFVLRPYSSTQQLALPR